MASAEEFAIKESSTAVKDYSTIRLANNGSADEQKRCCFNHRQKGNPFEHLVYFCSLAVASYLGVFTRIYLTKLVNWDGVPLFPSLYPQVVGTAIMGFISSHKQLLANSFLYQAIATGLCGSITTFSSWNSEAVSSLLQSDQVPPNNGARVLGWVTTSLLGLGMSSGALTVGRHLSILSPWADAKNRVKLRDLSPKCRVAEGCVFVCLWVVMTTLIAVLPAIYVGANRFGLHWLAGFSRYLPALAPLPSQLLFQELQTRHIPGECGWCMAVGWCYVSTMTGLCSRTSWWA